MYCSGDSLTELFAYTLKVVLGATGEPGVKDVNACSGNFKFSFKRNDYLDVSTRPFPDNRCRYEHSMSSDKCELFADDNTLKMFDILVVNSGAHWKITEDYGPAMKAASNSLASSMKRLHRSEATLIVRNTTPGHWNCTERRDKPQQFSKMVTTLLTPTRYR